MNEDKSVTAISYPDLFDRLRTIVDEEFGLQPVMLAEELVDTLEKLLNERRRKAQMRPDYEALLDDALATLDTVVDGEASEGQRNSFAAQTARGGARRIREALEARRG